MGRDKAETVLDASNQSFNPRAHVGRDAFSHTPKVVAGEFQSTRPRGARRTDSKEYPRGDGVSIHAPTWGATILTGLRSLTSKVSIHAPTWGATLLQLNKNPIQKSFNPRAHVGRDRIQPSISSKWTEFQSTRPRGARHAEGNILGSPIEFQSTRPRGARLANAGFGFNQIAFQSTRPRGARPQPAG